MEEDKILLHTCCAICCGYPIKYLRELGYKPVCYFFNPNIFPETEYQKRLEAQKTLCKALNCELIVEDFESRLGLPAQQHKTYNEAMTGFENLPEGSERCKKCFELRLSKTVQKAQELEISSFTTTLSISPYKNFDVIREIGKNLADCYKIDFADINFKKQDGFIKTNKIARELNLYRQNYCGCEKSLV